MLWCVVFQVIRPASITLSGSPAQPSGSPALQLGESRLDVEAPWGSRGQSGVAEQKVNVDTNLDEMINSWDLSNTVVERAQPNSVEFFGTRAYGNRFVFVLDISYSMKARGGERFRRASDELVRAVSQLRPDQSYYVFLFSWYTEEMYYQAELDYVRAESNHVDRLKKWIKDVSLGAGTDPRRALALAHQLKPDAIFLLSDGHFNQPISPNSETGWIDSLGNRSHESVLEGVKSRFQHTPVHTIAFENPFTAESMEEISNVTDGQFRYVSTASLEPVDLNQLTSALQQVESLRQDGLDRKSEFEYRMKHARELISSGELVSAEFLLRPVLQADDPLVDNVTLLEHLSGILETELGDVRMEDFEVSQEVFALIVDP